MPSKKNIEALNIKVCTLRKQYHFRPSPNGFFAWDIDRIVELALEIQPQDVRLDVIQELDEEFWFGTDSDSPTCRRIVGHIKLIQAADMAFPIILSSDGRVMDGMHRVSKALLLGLNTIKAVKFSSDPKPDYTDIQPSDLPY